MLPLSSTPANPAAEAFASTTLEIVNPEPQKIRHEYSPINSDGVHKTRAYYRDSSGRARVHLRVRLVIPTADENDQAVGSLGTLLECGCIQPVPVESKALRSSPDDANNDEESSKEKEEVNDEKDESNGDEEDVWKDELSTIGTEMKGAGANTSPWFTDTTFTFECTIVPSSNTENSVNPTSTWALEGVTILYSEIERSSPTDSKSPISALLFDIEVAVRGNGVIRSSDTMREMLEEGELELCAVLRQRNKFRGNDKDEDNKQGNSTNAAKSLLGGGNEGGGIAAGLLGLEFGGGSLSPRVIARGIGPGGTASSGMNNGNNNAKNKMEFHYGTKILRTSPPLRIHATLMPSLQLTVREVCGARAASGSTLVEITVEHSSRWHKENVTVSGIAFHPGQSRLWVNNNASGFDDGGDGSDENDSPNNKSSNPNNSAVLEGKSMQGGELSVIDMSRRVRWGFAPGSAPDLPLVLGPYEAFATVIQIDAGEDVRSRAFLSPISVNAMIGSSSSSAANGDHEKDGERIMVTADARWTSSRVGVENSDAFRVDMSLRGGHKTICRVGAPLVVSLRVLNLSMDPRDLMLLMAKDGEGRNSGGLQWERAVEGQRRRIGQQDRLGSGAGGNREHQLLHQQQATASRTEKNHSFNTAVVSEVNGYTFGVWGLSGDDDGTTRHHRDHELLAVDAALLLGEVKGQHSIEAELRFVPLREGTLDVPNLKLYDKRGMKWYNCVHTLKIVARQSNV